MASDAATALHPPIGRPAATGLTTPPVHLKRLALFLDMDGVLAPFAPTPEAVLPTARRTAILQRLDQVLEGRVAIVSGRALTEIDRITGGAARAASGVHGLELRRRDGVVQTAAEAPGVRAAVAAFHAFAADRPGVIVEDKGVSAGLHYRQAPDVSVEAAALADRLASQEGLALQAGDMVLELKTPGASKGTAVTAFMAQPPFAGATPIMLGDDLTDEDGFRAATDLGGFGVLVGPGRDTAARHRLDGVEAVLDWLEAVARHTTQKEDSPA